MRIKTPTGIATTILALVGFIVPVGLAGCDGTDPGGQTPPATVSGVVSDTAEAVIEGASVRIGSATSTIGADGRFELQNLLVGSTTIVTKRSGP